MKVILILSCLLVVCTGQAHAEPSWTCVQQWSEAPVYKWWDSMPESLQDTIVWRWYVGRYPVVDPEKLWTGTVGDAWEVLPEQIKVIIQTWQGWCRCQCEEP